jgi:hypothetical protein
MLVCLGLGVGLLGAGCGGGSSPNAATSVPTAVAAPAPSPTPVPLSSSETEQVNATIGDATQQIVQAILNQVTAQGLTGEVHSATVEPWSRQADLPNICTSGGAFFGGSGSFDDESGFVSGQGTLQFKQCGRGDGTVSDGSLMVQGVGRVPGNVSGTVTGDLSVYRIQPGGGLSLVTSSFGVLRNWACNVGANGQAICG